MKAYLRRTFIAFFLLIFSHIAVFSYDLTFRFEPLALVPFMSAGEEKWDPVGAGALLSMGIDLFGTVNVGAMAGYLYVPKNNNSELLPDEAKFVSVIPMGLQTSLTFYPFARLELGLGGAMGYGIAQNGNMSHFAPWYRGFAEAGFRFNPKWTLGLNGSYLAYQNTSWFGQPGIAGITAGISLKMHMETKKKSFGSGTVVCTAEIPDSLFPLFYTMYKENPFGTIKIKNNESAEIRNVSVSFKAKGYTASELECGHLSSIRKGKTKELQLVADFSKEILRFTEAGKIPGEIIVSYELLGQKKESVSSIIVPVYNRNQMRWTDPQAISAYISASAPEVLEFSKVLVGLARTHLRSGVNRNLQFAMYVFEGMRLASIRNIDDFETPYYQYHTDDSLVDHIQYPYQTMFYRAGDKDEMAILFMALLESVGIKAAYIPLENDFLVLINTGIDGDKADRFFDGEDRILEFENQIWVPISMKMIQEGFINSWHNGARDLTKLIMDDADLSIVFLEEAWQIYPSAGFTSNENVSVSADEKRLVAACEVDLARYVSTEFGPKIKEAQDVLKTEGATAENYNQLGILYVRAGMYKEAASIYQKSAALGNIAAMNNLGNIASLQKNFLEAKKWYEKALAADPKNASARKNLERVLGELE